MNILNSSRVKHVPTLLAMAFLGFAATSQAATLIYEEDFETVNADWSTGTTYANGDLLFAEAAGPTTAFPTRSLLLTHDAGMTNRITSVSPSRDFSIARTENEIYSFEFDARVSRTNMNSFLILYDRNNNSQNPLLVWFSPSGNIEIGYWTGTANVNFTLLSNYAVDTTYTFTFLTNPSTNLFSASVSGGTAEIIDAEFRRTTTGTSPFVNFNGLLLVNDGGEAMGDDFDLYVDNVAISIISESTSVAR